MVPLNDFEKAFENSHPDMDVLNEGHGSIQVIRQVTELHHEADIIAVADYSLIPLMMYDVMSDDGKPYADWTVQFTGNRLGIAYVPESRFSGDINTANWYSVLSNPDVRLGLSDPRFDSLGYRALMLILLSENYYQDNSIFERMVYNNFNPLFSIVEEDGQQVILVPELVRPNNERIFLRAYSVQLLALLQAREIDYAFEYESVARQFGLEFLALPPEIDLSSYKYASEYKKVAVRLDFQRFASVLPSFEGQQILYGLTIPYNAPHPEAAWEYIDFLFGPDGQQVFRDSFHPLLTPIADNPGNLPPALRDLLNIIE